MKDVDYLKDYNLQADFSSQGTTVIDKLQEWQELKGSAPCLFYGEDNVLLSYEEFCNLCNRVANGLASKGVCKGDRVSLLSKNAYVSTVAMVAIWKLGAVYCPVCTHYEGDMLAYVLNDTASNIVIADQYFIESLNAIRSNLPQINSLVVYEPVEGDHDYNSNLKAGPDHSFDTCTWSSLLGSPDIDPNVLVGEDDLANIIYTSGTTGNPKGVVQSHKWLHNYCYLRIRRALATPDHPVTIYNDLPLYHVGGAFFNIVSGLWGGSKIALWDRFSPKDFWRRIRISGATDAILIDVMMDWLMKNPASPDDTDNNLLLVSMTPLPKNHLEIARRFGIQFIISGYGSTEVGVGFFGVIDVDPIGGPQAIGCYQHIVDSYQQISPKMMMKACDFSRKGYMGIPSPLMDVSVLDNEGNQVGANQSGRAVFRPKIPGIILREYFNKPALTEEALQDGRYYSPDIVQYDTRGHYYFEDRIQGVIRVRGENVSATSVENQLNKHPSIQRSAVIGIPAKEGNEQEIAAYLILNTGDSFDEQSLLVWIKEFLPKFMQPKYLRYVDEFPITNTYKVEKHKLKETMMRELQH